MGFEEAGMWFRCEVLDRIEAWKDVFQEADPCSVRPLARSLYVDIIMYQPHDFRQ